MLVEIRTAKITEKGQITIPKESRIDGFKVGKKVAIFTFEDKIEIKPMKNGKTVIKEFDERDLPYIMSEKALAEYWDNEKEDEAWKNL